MKSGYVPSAELPTYADYRRAKQREHRAAWKTRNAESYTASENARRKAKYASDEAYAEKLRTKATATYHANPEAGCARAKKHREDNLAAHKAFDRAYYLANKPALQAYKQGWTKRNAASVNRRTAARRALCAKATPLWADKSAINDVYAEARHMQMHVDHIVPLNHPLVCGLHVWENLQLLTPLDNMRKNNKFDPEVYLAS